MKNKINNIEIASMLMLLLLSSSIGINLFTTIKIVGHNFYISNLISIIIGLIPLFIFIYIFNYEKDLTIKEKLIKLFGKYIGNTINIILTLIYFIIGVTYIFNLSNFIVSQYLSDTPVLLVAILLLLVIYNIINKGLTTITRSSSIFTIIVLFLFTFSIFYLFKEFKIDNLKPVLNTGIISPLKGSIVSTLITTTPIYLLLIIPKNNINNNNKVNKYIIISYLIAMLIIFLISITSVGVLGKYLVKLYQYPGYTSLKKISIFGFIDRIENFISLEWLLSIFITISLIIFYIKNNIKKDSNSKLLSISIILLILIIAFKVFTNNTIFNNYTYKIYPYILIVPSILYIIIAIKIYIRKIKKFNK